MSIEALNWAFMQEVPNSSAKFVLVAMANRASPDSKGRTVVFTSQAYLVAITAQDRKTVGNNVDKLREWGLISDTGQRVGRTAQVPVYELACPPDLFTEGAQKGNSPKNGTVPKKDGNTPVFPMKGPQKRDTDSAFDSSTTQKAAFGQGQDNRSGKQPPAAEVMAAHRPQGPLASKETTAAALAEIQRELKGSRAKPVKEDLPA